MDEVQREKSDLVPCARVDLPVREEALKKPPMKGALGACESGKLVGDFDQLLASSFEAFVPGSPKVGDQIVVTEGAESRKHELKSTLEVSFTSDSEFASDTEVNGDGFTSVVEEPVTAVEVCVNYTGLKKLAVETKTDFHLVDRQFAEESRSDVIVVSWVSPDLSIDGIHNHDHFVDKLGDGVNLRSQTSFSSEVLLVALLEDVEVTTIFEDLNGLTVDDVKLAEAAEGDWLAGLELS